MTTTYPTASPISPSPSQIRDSRGPSQEKRATWSFCARLSEKRVTEYDSIPGLLDVGPTESDSVSTSSVARHWQINVSRISVKAIIGRVYRFSEILLSAIGEQS